MNKARYWIVIYFVIVVSLLGMLACRVVIVDPYMHYHMPLTEEYYYSLNNQRSMNNGIIRHFDYDALITGTSMAENFKTSQFDSIFGVKSIKVPFSGGRFKEINDNIVLAIKYNPNLKTVIRCIDYSMLFYDKDSERTDLGKYPEYLYDDCVFNDVEYILNRDIIFDRVYTMGKNRFIGEFEPGITSFDDYSNWMRLFTFGADTIYRNKAVSFSEPENLISITEDEARDVKDSVIQNLTTVARDNPDVIFYYYFPPYSAAWWQETYQNGELAKYIEAEKIAIEEMLKYSNIKLFSINNNLELTADLNNYKDTTHYGEWINSCILKWMHEGEFLITEDNYNEYLSQELENYSLFDYNSLIGQTDYYNDYYADALVRYYYSGVMPLTLDEYSNVENNCFAKLDGKNFLECAPVRESPKGYDNIGEYDGCPVYQWVIANDKGYRYFVCDAKADGNVSKAGVYFYNSEGKLIDAQYVETLDDDNVQQLFLDISEYPDEFTAVFFGGNVIKERNNFDNTVFENIYLY